MERVGIWRRRRWFICILGCSFFVSRLISRINEAEYRDYKLSTKMQRTTFTQKQKTGSCLRIENGESTYFFPFLSPLYHGLQLLVPLQRSGWPSSPYSSSAPMGRCCAPCTAWHRTSQTRRRRRCSCERSCSCYSGSRRWWPTTAWQAAAMAAAAVGRGGRSRRGGAARPRHAA